MILIPEIIYLLIDHPPCHEVAAFDLSCASSSATPSLSADLPSRPDLWIYKLIQTTLYSIHNVGNTIEVPASMCGHIKVYTRLHTSKICAVFANKELSQASIQIS